MKLNKNQQLGFVLLEHSFWEPSYRAVQSHMERPCVLVICCCVTNNSKMSNPKAIIAYLSLFYKWARGLTCLTVVAGVSKAAPFRWPARARARASRSPPWAADFRGAFPKDTALRHSRASIAGGRSRSTRVIMN